MPESVPASSAERGVRSQSRMNDDDEEAVTGFERSNGEKPRPFWLGMFSPRESFAHLPASSRAAEGIAPAGSVVTIAHGVLLAAQVVALIVFALPWRQIAGFPLDDAWIHQVVARTFAESGTLGYTAGQYGAGATSYLWAAILAANFRWFHVDPVVSTAVFNIVAFVLGGHLFLRILLNRAIARDSARTEWTLESGVIAAVASLGGNFIWFVFSGMEATFFALLSFAAIASFTYEGPRKRASTIACSVSLALLALTRPEAIPVAFLLVVFARRFRRSLREMIVIFGGWSAGLALYVGSNLIKAGTPTPATLEGRRWLWLDSFAGDPYSSIVRGFFAQWALRLREYTLGTSATWLWWISIGLALYGVRRAFRTKSDALLLLAAWAMTHVAIYLVIMPTTGHGGRYQPLLPFLYLAFTALGTIGFLGDLRSFFRKKAANVERLMSAAVLAGGAAPWVGLTIVGLADWHKDEAAAVAHIDATEIAMARAIAELPQGARVASFDIGATGFFAGRPILDLGALTDRRAFLFLREGRLWEYLKENGIAYVVLPLGYNDFPDLINFGYRLHLVNNPHIALDLVKSLVSEPPTWVPSIRSTGNSAPRQELYRVRYLDPAPSPVLPVRGVSQIDDPQSLVSARIHGELSYSAAVLERAGAPVHLALRKSESDAVDDSSEEVWRIKLGGWGASVAPPASLGPQAAEYANKAMRAWLHDYFDVGDIGGASRVALYVVMLSMRESVERSFFPMLPPIPFPAPRVSESSPESTYEWGIPLALFTFGIAFGLSRVAARRSSKRGAS